MEKLILLRVRPEDREEVLAPCRNIWGGLDYIPYVFDEFLRGSANPKITPSDVLPCSTFESGGTEKTRE